MRTPAILVTVSTVLAFCLTTPASSDAGGLADELDNIEWNVVGPQRLQIRREGFSTSLSVAADEPELAQARVALKAPAGERVTFTLSREPGALSCRGTIPGRHARAGTCRFVVHPWFAAALRQRGIGTLRDNDALAMTLVDVDLAFVDGLLRQGIALRNAGDVIGAAALHGTPAYVASLNSAGLTLTDLEDVIACRALGVDAAFVRGILAAGYRPDVRQILALKAVGVTPDYADKMAAAARREGENR